MMHKLAVTLTVVAFASACTGKSKSSSASPAPVATEIPVVQNTNPAPETTTASSTDTAMTTHTAVTTDTSTSTSTTTAPVAVATAVPTPLFTYRADVNVAVMDSGVDNTNPTLANQMWRNAGENEFNAADDESNGYVNDVHGWSFIDQSNQTFDRATYSALPTDLNRYLKLRANLGQNNSISADDTTWFNTKTSDIQFVSAAEVYSTLSHGTHVAGIVIKDNPRTKVMSLKVLATQDTSTFSYTNTNLVDTGKASYQTVKFFADNFISGFTGGESRFKEVVSYAARNHAIVANCSFNLTSEDIRKAIEEYSSNIPFGLNLASLNIGVDVVFDRVGASMQRDFATAPGTLFVMAAGNEALNNDTQKMFPANIKLPNTITVAATKNRESLATFSNYGPMNVEVAAPGVFVESAAPGGQTLLMSGTSMAAPYVANAASQLKSINPALSVTDIKAIILQTVDVKSFLAGKVLTSGIVNPRRAKVAAELSTKLALTEAIAQAKTLIAGEANDK